MTAIETWQERLQKIIKDIEEGRITDPSELSHLLEELAEEINEEEEDDLEELGTETYDE